MDKAIKRSRQNVMQSSHNVYKLSTQNHTELRVMKIDHMYLFQNITQLNYIENEEKSLHRDTVI